VSELARRAFGVTGEPIELPGGVSGVFRYHDVILKPVTDVAEAEWEQATFAALTPRDDVRWARPIAADDGRWVVDGWIANEFIPGLAPVAPNWATVIEYGARFHFATESIEPPTEMLRARSHRWARGERHAFDEEPVALTPVAASIDAELRDRCAPDPTHHQVVHVDLSGNVFLDPDHAPVVLDIAPGFRTHRYAAAVVIGDALLWSGADPGLIELLGPPATAYPLLARALRFRLVTEQIALAGGVTSAYGGHLDPYRQVLRQMS
jgi:hypothetical protein